MTLDVVLAISEKEKQDAFSVRYKVFTESGLSEQNAFEKDIDEFDYLPTTHHFVAYDKGVPVGACRLLEKNSAKAEQSSTDYGLRIESEFEIRPKNNTIVSNIGELSRSSVMESHRRKPVLLSMYISLLDFCEYNGIENIITAVTSDTDCLEDAQLMYKAGSILNYRSSRFVLIPKDEYHSAPTNPQKRYFDFPKTNRLGDVEKEWSVKDISEKPRLGISKLGMKFCGTPLYDELYKVCLLPMHWDTGEALDTNTIQYFTRRAPHLRKFTSIRETA